MLKMVKPFICFLLLLLVITPELTRSWDPMQALQAFGNTYCSSGGGLKYWSTGPEYSSGGYPCDCLQQAGGNWTWCGYPYMCVGYFLTTSPLYYTNIVQTSGTPFIFTSYFDNDSNVTDQIDFVKSESTSNSYSWTFSESFTVGFSVSVDAGIPFICETHDDFSMELSLNETKTQTGSDSKSWDVSEQIGIPPMSTVRVDLVITSGNFNADFTNAITFDPNSYGDIWCYDTVSGHYEWFIPPSTFLDGNFGNGIYCNNGSCNVTGTFTAIQGISVFVNVTQCALYQHC